VRYWGASRRSGVMAVLCVLGSAAPLGGCVTYSASGADDGPGERHVFGLVVVVVDQREPADRPALTTSTSVGLGLRLGGPDPGLALGYSRDASLALPPDSCVAIERPGLCAGALAEGDKP